MDAPKQLPIRVLLADDEESLLTPLAQRLAADGFAVTAVASGAAALEAAFACEGRLDVAVLDQLMPRPDGIETMIRLHASYPDIAAIILTGWGGPVDGLRALQSGAYRYVSKPFSFDELRLLIQVAARYNRETRQRKVLHQTLAISRAMQGAATSKELVQRILTGIQALGYDRARIYLLNKERTHLTGLAEMGGTNTSFGKVEISVREPYTAHLRHANAPCIFAQGQYRDRWRRVLDKEDLLEWAEFLLQWEGRTIGKLTVDNKHSRRPLTQQDLDDVQLFAAQVAAALAHMERMETENETLHKLAEAGQAIASAKTEDELFLRLRTHLRRLLPGVDAFLITRYDAQHEVVALPYWWVQGKRLRRPPRQRRNGITEYVLRTREPLLLPDGDEAFRAAKGLEEPGEGVPCGSSLIAAPTYMEGKLFGSISVLTQEKRVRYSEQDCALLQAFGSHVVVAMQNVRQLVEGEELRKASAALAAAKGKQAVMTAIVNQAHTMIGAGATGLVLQQADGVLTRVQPYKPRRFFRLMSPPRQQGGVTRYVIETRQPLVIADTAAEPRVAGQPRFKPELVAEGIRSSLALPLTYGDRVLAVLHADMRELRAFPQWELNLWSAFASQAAAVLHTALQEHDESERLNRRLRAVTAILHSQHEPHSVREMLDKIAHAAQDLLGLDVCTVHEYNSVTRTWATRGAAGLRTAHGPGEVRREFHDFLRAAKPTVIVDAAGDVRLQGSSFVRAEGIASCVICSLRAGGDTMGLLFANYRRRKLPSTAEVESIRLFADLAAQELHGARLLNDLQETKARLDRNALLTWVNMLNDTWLHSLAQFSGAMSLRSGILESRLAGLPEDTRRKALEDVAELRRLAQSISNAPPRVPQSWEMEPERIALAPLLLAVAERQDRVLKTQVAGDIRVAAEAGNLGEAAVTGYRAWLVYALEALVQNGRSAVQRSGRAHGQITLSGRLADGWAELRVHDNGAGVPPEIRRRLFREVMRSRQDKAGMGIGALLAATIIEEHRGAIKLERTGSRGSTVLIRLPLGGA